MEFPFPKIPTDNLYKFAAIIGSLFLLIGIFTSPVIRSYEMSELQKEMQRHYDDSVDQVLVDYKLGFFAEIDSAEDLIAKWKYNMAKSRLGKDTGDLYIQELERMTNANVKRIRRGDSIIRNGLKDHSGQYEKVIPSFVSGHLLNFMYAACFVFVIGGFYLAFWGFKNWHKKLQKPLDLWYQKQIEDIKPPHGENSDLKGSDQTMKDIK